MKKLFFVSVIFLLALPMMAGEMVSAKRSASAPKKETKGGKAGTRMSEETAAINPVAEENFKVEEGNTSRVRWTKEGIFDEASYVKDGIRMMDYFDFSGNLVATTSIRKFSDLPVKTQDKIKSEYKDYKVGTVLFYNDKREFPTEVYMYGHEFDSSDNWFVELKKDTRTLVLKISPDGEIFLFTEL